MTIFLVLFICLGTAWAEESSQEKLARERGERLAQLANDRKETLDRLASEREETMSQLAAQRKQVQYYAPSYGGGYQPQPLSQEGAVAIGERVSPPNEIFRSAIDCVKELGNDKDTRKFCKDVAQKTLEETGNVARSGRKAVPRPAPILLPRYGGW